jgi:hypothetical protein
VGCRLLLSLPPAACPCRLQPAADRRRPPARPPACCCSWKLEAGDLGTNHSVRSPPYPANGSGRTLWGGRPLRAGPTYDVWSHSGDSGSVVELYPMEIRTWLLHLG